MMRWRKTVRTALWILMLTATVAFVEHRRGKRTCQQLVIRIAQTGEHRFINQDDIRQLVTQQHTTTLEGTRLRDINLKMLEKNVATNNYVQHVNVYHDLAGNVVVQTRQNRPVARISPPRGADRPDAYLGADGRLLPLSERFTARVVVLSGDYTDSLLNVSVPEDSVGAQILELVHYVEQDEFWHAQIAQIDIDKYGEITLYPQVGKQRIAFGGANRLAEKFDKLTVFYDQILPRKGWNHYEQISLKYQNQIVCQ